MAGAIRPVRAVLHTKIVPFAVGALAVARAVPAVQPCPQ